MFGAQFEISEDICYVFLDRKDAAIYIRANSLKVYGCPD